MRLYCTRNFQADVFLRTSQHAVYAKARYFGTLTGAFADKVPCPHAGLIDLLLELLADVCRELS